MFTLLLFFCSFQGQTICVPGGAGPLVLVDQRDEVVVVEGILCAVVDIWKSSML